MIDATFTSLFIEVAFGISLLIVIIVIERSRSPQIHQWSIKVDHSTLVVLNHFSCNNVLILLIFATVCIALIGSHFVNIVTLLLRVHLSWGWEVVIGGRTTQSRPVLIPAVQIIIIEILGRCRILICSTATVHHWFAMVMRLSRNWINSWRGRFSGLWSLFGGFSRIIVCLRLFVEVRCHLFGRGD